MNRTIEEISVGTTSGADYREQLRKVHADLDAARSTISEQEKRIAAFEKHQEEQARLISGLAHDAERNFDALTSERQRREEAETVLSRYTGTDIPGSGAASDYFSKYEPIPADREEERNATNDQR